MSSSITPYLGKILCRRYIEPFLGSGAVFFSLKPKRAVLADLNKELIEVYEQVRLHPALLERRLSSLLVDEHTYYSIRAQSPRSKLERALRFIYLNRTCFGGLYRTNKTGKFNVPYGGGSRTPEPVYRDHLLLQAALLLDKQRTELVACDFSHVVNAATEGDIVFCDPTYQSAGRGRFDRYGPTIFTWADQRRLAMTCRAAAKRGAVVIVMNADADEVSALYPGATLLCKVSRRKTIGNRANDESRHRELLAVLDPLERHELWAGLRSELARHQLVPTSRIAGAA